MGNFSEQNREISTERHHSKPVRYAGQEWERIGTVHVELCGSEPEDKPWSERDVEAWIESHATYEVLTQLPNASP